MHARRGKCRIRITTETILTFERTATLIAWSPRPSAHIISPLPRKHPLLLFKLLSYSKKEKKATNTAPSRDAAHAVRRECYVCLVDVEIIKGKKATKKENLDHNRRLSEA